MQRKQRSHYKIKRKKLFTEAKGKDPLLNQHLHRDLTVANRTADRPTITSNATDTGNGWVKTEAGASAAVLHLSPGRQRAGQLFSKLCKPIDLKSLQWSSSSSAKSWSQDQVYIRTYPRAWCIQHQCWIHHPGERRRHPVTYWISL